MAATSTPTSTISSFLMHIATVAAEKPTKTEIKAGEKVVDITGYPDFGGEPEKIDVTTLSDKVSRSVNGVQQLESMSFGANYTAADFTKLKELEKKGESEWWAVLFGEDESGTPDGHDGVVFWQGGVTPYITSGEVNGARSLNMVFSTVTAPDFYEDLTEG